MNSSIIQADFLFVFFSCDLKKWSFPMLVMLVKANPVLFFNISKLKSNHIFIFCLSFKNTALRLKQVLSRLVF